MKLMNDLRSKVTNKLSLLVLILFILQPLMDVLSFWVAKWGLPNLLTLALRLLVLAAMVLAGFWLSPKKKVYVIAACICAFIGIGHILASWGYGYQSLVSDVSNYIRVLQLPLTALCLITFMRVDERCYDSIKKGIAINLSIILAVQLLAIITGTEPHTYDDGYGLIGWFSNTNTQSAIMSMVGPLAVSWLYQRKGLNSIWLWVCLIGSGVSMFYLGTRLAYLGIIAMCFGLGCCALIVCIRDWKRACVLFLVGIVFAAMLPFSPMMGHRSDHDKQMGDKQGWLDASLDDPNRAPTTNPKPITSLKPGGSQDPDDSGLPVFYDEELVNSLTEEQLAKIEELTPNYNHYVSDLVAIFGVERTIVMFDFTTDITVMTNLRTKKLLVADALMDMSPVSVQLFGIELARFTIGPHIYDVENDFHGIYYLYGIFGLAAIVLFIAYFLFLIVKYLIKNFKRYFTLDAAGWGIALVMCLAHSYFTAGVLRRPSASFYLAAALAAVFYLLKIKKYPDETEVG